MESLYVAAVGHALPEEQLSDSLVKEASENGDGIDDYPSDRRTALKADYIRETLNSDPFVVEDALVETPTTLATRAARQALSKLATQSDSLGLILGATATALQTTPLESQRVGKELNVKIPAYDIQGGGADLALHLETLSSWKRDRIAEFTLALSTHIPTSRLDYRSGWERFAYGDGAGVAIVSPAKGRYRIERAEARVFPAHAGRFSIELYGHLQMESSLEEDFFVPQLKTLADEISASLSKDALFIESQLMPSSHTRLKELVGGEHWVSYWPTYGNTLGAAPALSLSLLEEEEDALASTEQVVLLQSGLGLSVGAVVLTREE